MALLVMLSAALGLPLSALHLGHPFLAMSAMKNIKTSMGMLGAKENEYQLQRSKRLLNENFGNIKKFRFVTLLIASIVLPLLALLFLSVSLKAVASILFVALLTAFVSEISDRFLFFTTVVPLGMAGGFFVGKQR